MENITDSRLKILVESINKNFEIIKVEDEIKDGTGFFVEFKNSTINMFYDTFEKINRVYEDAEELLDELHIEFEIISENGFKIVISGA